MLLGVGYLTNERPDLPILNGNTGEDLERRVPLILTGFVDEKCPTQIRPPHIGRNFYGSLEDKDPVLNYPPSPYTFPVTATSVLMLYFAQTVTPW